LVSVDLRRRTRMMIKTCQVVLLTVLLVDSTATATAQGPPGSGAVSAAPDPVAVEAIAIGAGTWELRFGMGPSFTFPGTLVASSSQSGLGIHFFDVGRRTETITNFGMNVGFARYFSKNVAVGLLFDVNVSNVGDSTLASFGVSPVVRGLVWISKRANFFGELVVGYSGLGSGGSSSGFQSWFHIGASLGGEYLVGSSWGLRVWTGFTGLIATGQAINLYEIPLRWGVIGYF
jgi:hypothetical protein